MNEDTARKYARIKQDGSILLGDNTVCDGADSDRGIGVFTHIHRDHTDLFNKAMPRMLTSFRIPSHIGFAGGAGSGF